MQKNADMKIFFRLNSIVSDGILCCGFSFFLWMATRMWILFWDKININNVKCRIVLGNKNKKRLNLFGELQKYLETTT